jgi:hypothetical protein
MSGNTTYQDLGRGVARIQDYLAHRRQFLWYFAISYAAIKIYSLVMTTPRVFGFLPELGSGGCLDIIIKRVLIGSIGAC